MVVLRPELFELLCGYSALVHPRTLSFPSHLPFGDIHSFLVESVLLNHLLNAYPPSKSYQRSFWKWAIHQLESMLSSEVEDVEIDPRIYTHYMSLLPLSHEPAVSPPAQSYVTHFWRTGFPTHQSTPAFVDTQRYQTMTLLESRTTIEGGTTGLRTWPASTVLSQYLSLHPDVVANKRVLELGCGTGFLGIVVAALQQLSASPSDENPSLWLSDVNEEVLVPTSCPLKPDASSAHPNLNYCLLDWSFALDPLTRPRIKALLSEIDPELILGADLVFDPTVLTALIGVLCLALQRKQGSKSKLAVLALTVRNEETFANFIWTAGRFLHTARNLFVAEVPGGMKEQSLAIEEIPFAVDDKMCLGVVDSCFGIKREVKMFRIASKK